MALFEEELPRKKSGHEVGQDLSLLSVAEIDERIALLVAEIERLKQARQAKDATKSAADALFRKG
jgi:uncharacterized small protein (DUF1192 family)